MPLLNEISVVIPMHNAEDTIALCLDSIYSKLKNLREVIVVDDCSVDRSVEVAHGFHCRILRLDECGGAGRARNIGAREAKGRFILFIDSDIVLKGDISEKIIRYIRPEEKIIAVVGIFSEEHPHSNVVSQYKNLHARYKYYILPEFISSLHTSITAIDRDSFSKIGGFNESSKVEDVELGETIVSNGYRIYFDKTLEVVHLKKLNLKKMLAADFWKTKALAAHFWKIKNKKRIIREGVINDISFYLPISMASSFFAVLFFCAGIFFKPMIVIAMVLILVFIVANIRFWSYLMKIKGFKFVLVSSGINFIDMNCAALATLTALSKIILHSRRPAR